MQAVRFSCLVPCRHLLLSVMICMPSTPLAPACPITSGPEGLPGTAVVAGPRPPAPHILCSMPLLHGDVRRSRTGSAPRAALPAAGGTMLQAPARRVIVYMRRPLSPGRGSATIWSSRRVCPVPRPTMLSAISSLSSPLPLELLPHSLAPHRQSRHTTSSCALSCPTCRVMPCHVMSYVQITTPALSWQSRILFHVAHKRGDEAALMQRHQDLSEGLEDEMSLASVHYQRGHYQEATGGWVHRGGIHMHAC